MTKALAHDDPRLARPLYTLAETASYLGMPASTIPRWAGGADERRIITVLNHGARIASVPFIGFAEAYVLSAFRRAGVTLQRIRPAVEGLRRGIGLEHALASQSLYTDGAEVIYDYAESSGDEQLRQLTVVRTGQRQFGEVIKQYLTRITYGTDHYAEQLQLATFGRADVVVDPRRAFGGPLLQRSGARVEDLIDRFFAGEAIAALAKDFDATPVEVEEVIRGATHPAVAA